jgi:hypothetical protein
MARQCKKGYFALRIVEPFYALAFYVVGSAAVKADLGPINKRAWAVTCWRVQGVHRMDAITSAPGRVTVMVRVCVAPTGRIHDLHATANASTPESPCTVGAIHDTPCARRRWHPVVGARERLWRGRAGEMDVRVQNLCRCYGASGEGLASIDADINRSMEPSMRKPKPVQSKRPEQRKPDDLIGHVAQLGRQRVDASS